MKSEGTAGALYLEEQLWSKNEPSATIGHEECTSLDSTLTFLRWETPLSNMKTGTFLTTSLMLNDPLFLHKHMIDLLCLLLLITLTSINLPTILNQVCHFPRHPMLPTKRRLTTTGRQPSLFPQNLSLDQTHLDDNTILWDLNQSHLFKSVNGLLKTLRNTQYLACR